MKALTNLANRVKSLNINDLMLALSEDKSYTDFIIELNTKNQLFNKGVNANGVELQVIGGKYSEVTLALHPEKRQGIIDLYDTGQFYESFKVYLDSQSDLTIEANTIKTDFDGSTDLIDRWGKEILGLNEESLSLLKPRTQKIALKYIKDTILKR